MGMSKFLGLAVKRVVARVSRVEILVGAAQLERSKAEILDRMLQLFDTAGIVRVHTGHAHQLVRVLPDILVDIIVGNHQSGGIHHHGENSGSLHSLRHLFPVFVGRDSDNCWPCRSWPRSPLPSCRPSDAVRRYGCGYRL